jgi:hypothetical protein
MKCEKCNYEMTAEAKVCSRCGTPVAKDELKSFVLGSESKQMKKEESEMAAIQKVEYFYVSPKRLIILSIITVGLYEIYWFYKNWEAVGRTLNKKVNAFFRALFSIFYCNQLFKMITNSARQTGYNASRPGSFWGWLYITILIASNLFGSIFSSLTDDKIITNSTILYLVPILLFAFSCLTVLPLVAIQKEINHNNEKINPGVINQKRNYTSAEVVIIVIGVILFLMQLLALFAPEFGN